MAARMTPLAKGLLTLIIVGLAGAAAWHLGLKKMIGRTDSGELADSTDNAVEFAATSGDRKPLGTASNPLKISIVSFHGYAPAILANGKSLTTKPGSIFAQQGVNVEFVIQDDIPTLATIFESKSAQCAWRTSDFWAQEQPNLRNNGLDARAIMVVDNTQGADAIIARDSGIRRVEDLAGKKVALLQYTPSHGMVIDAVDNSSLSARKKQSINYVYINVDEGTAGVRAAFVSGQVDAAVLWDPDLSLALKNVRGSHVVYSTKTATNLIYDVIVCDSRVVDDPPQREALQNFVAGWMKGVAAAEASPDDAVDALVKTEEFFTLLAKDEGRGFVKSLFENLVWTGLEDNARILGLADTTNHYERVYKRFDRIYREAGALANPKSPVINPDQSFDYRFIRNLMSAAPAVAEQAKEPQFEFSEQQREQASSKEAALTKPVTVSFRTGSAELNKRAEHTIDSEMVPLIENNGSAYFEVSGNTDSTGSRATNMKLSKERAQGVVNYLVEQWEFPKERFVVVGNGPDKPICDEKNPAAEGVALDECRGMNRTTRLAVLSR